MDVNYVTRRRRTGPTSRTIDVQRLAKALHSKIDSRIWVSFATVGIRDDTGEFSIDEGKDPNIISGAKVAVFATPAGVLVDVRLEPTGHIVTANYHGFCSGRAGSCLFPIFAGDAVIVLIPDGDLNSPGICALPCGSNATALIPNDWTSNVGTPRVLLDLKVPFEVRAPSITLTARNGQVKLNGRAVLRGNETI